MPSPALSLEDDFLDIDEELIPIREAKQAGQTSLDFGGLLSSPLLLHEDLKEGCGGQLWPAGMVLVKYLLRNIELIKGKVILELGAGGGLVGLALAKALEHFECQESTRTPPILITDLPILLPLQEKNIKINGLPPAAILSSELSWGSPLPDSLLVTYRKPDVILAADCVYFEPAFPLLLETLTELLDSDDSKTDAVCYFCMKKRRKADMRFITTLKKKFKVEEVDARQEIQEEGGGIFLYKVWRKAK